MTEVQGTEAQTTEISIVLIQAGNFNQLMDEPGQVFYDIYRTYLKTQDLVLRYAETAYGTYVSIGNGRFMIFSTRRDVEQSLQDAQNLVDSITDLTSLPVNIGIGYGRTAREAERSARRALNYADKTGRADLQNHIIILDAAGEITEPLPNAPALSYEYRSENKELMAKLHQCGIGIATYHKLLSVQRASATNAVNSVYVADALDMTPRNARNILASLESAGLATIVGKESSVPKGRPRNIYRIIENLSERT